MLPFFLLSMSNCQHCPLHVESQGPRCHKTSIQLPPTHILLWCIIYLPHQRHCHHHHHHHHHHQCQCQWQGLLPIHISNPHQSPWLKDSKSAARTVSSPVLDSSSSPVSPSIFDAPSNILTSQPSPLSPTSAKATRTASNIEKVRKKIAAKAAAHGKKKIFAKRYIASSSAEKSNSMQSKWKAKGGNLKASKKRAPVKLQKRRTHDNLFDD